jgi:hypothetical protein
LIKHVYKNHTDRSKLTIPCFQPFVGPSPAHLISSQACGPLPAQSLPPPARYRPQFAQERAYRPRQGSRGPPGGPVPRRRAQSRRVGPCGAFTAGGRGVFLSIAPGLDVVEKSKPVA